MSAARILDEAEAWRAVADLMAGPRRRQSDFLADAVWYLWSARRVIAARTRNAMLYRLRWWEADARHPDAWQRDIAVLAALWLAIDAEEETFTVALERSMEFMSAVLTEDVQAEDEMMAMFESIGAPITTASDALVVGVTAT